MFVVAARRGPASGEGGLQTFIDRQIDAAKAPAKAHVFMRSGTDVTSLNQANLAESKAEPIDMTRYYTNPLAIPVKQKSNAYLSTIHFLPDPNLEPELKKLCQEDPITSLRIHTPNYSTSTLSTVTRKSQKQDSDLASQPVLPESTKRWGIQRHGETQRSSNSVHTGPKLSVSASAFELKTKEDLLLYLNDMEQYLKPALDDCLSILMRSTPNVN